MKLVLYRAQGREEVVQGLLTPAGVVDITAAVALPGYLTPQQRIEATIDGFDRLRPALLERERDGGAALPVQAVQLLAPLPRPGKMLCCIGNYWEHQQRTPQPINMFLKNSDAVIGPGETVVLPRTTEPWAFQHEAELAVVIKGPAKDVSADNWRSAVFGYTAMIDVSARAEGRFTWRRGSWMGKSFDTFGPLGPCIVTADEIPDPNDLWVKMDVSGEPRHDYVTNDMEHQVPELVAFATGLMTLRSGDVIACGTNHEGLGQLQDGDVVTIEIEKIGAMTIDVRDPLKRTWPRGVYMGPNSTHPDAVAERNRQAAAKA